MLITTGFSQVFGEIRTDNRTITTDIDYTVYHSEPGKLVFDIAVDTEGNVTSCQLNKSESTITFSGAVIQGKNKIMQHLKFERGHSFPKFHRGYVLIKTSQEKPKEDNKFAPPPQ